MRFQFLLPSIKTRLLKGFFACLFLCWGLSLQATIRYVKPSNSGSGNGLSWANASADLQAMISASSSGDQVWVAAGTYKPTTGTDRTISFSMKNGVAIYGGFLGNDTETQLPQRNWVANPTILSGDIGTPDTHTDNSYHVFNNPSDINNSAILDGFVITAGNADNSAGSALQQGGGMDNSNSSPTLSNCIFRGNSAGYNGGAMANSFSSPILTNCSFYGNSATYSGGAITNYQSSPVFKNCTFSGNLSHPDLGVINNNSPNTLAILSNCIVWGNSSGIVNNNNGSVTITYSIIEGGYSGIGNINQNPLFVSQPSIGLGTTGNLHLQACSPAINTGNNTGISGTDLDHNPRIYNNDTVDMGAYEYQGNPPPPTITCPGNQTRVLGANCSVAIGDFTALATASSNCSPPLTVTQSPGALTVLNGAGATQTVTLTARDAANRTASCTFTVTAVDQTPPTITCPGNRTVAAGANCNALLPNYTGLGMAMDNCTASPTITQSPAAGTVLGLGSTTVTLTATDASNRTASCTFSVSVVDQTAPTITCPANITQPSAPSQCGAVVTFANATANDNCLPAPTVLNQGQASGSFFSVGTTEVTFRATDGANNSSTCTFTVEITRLPEICNGLDDDCNGTVDDVAVNCSVAGTRTWAGTLSTDWNTPCNWNPACVPGANDDVVIPDVTNNPIIGAGTTALAKSVTVQSDAVLTIAATGSLNINGFIPVPGFPSITTAFFNAGTVTNNGILSIGSTSSAGIAGIWNTNTFNNNAGGQLFINSTTGNGFGNTSNAATMTNAGNMAIGGIASVQTGINNQGSFTNTLSGEISIDNATSRGIQNFVAITFLNYGTITIGASGNLGAEAIRNISTPFENSGCTAVIKILSNSIIFNTGIPTKDFNNSGLIIENATGTSNITNNTGVVQNLNGGTFTVASGNPAITFSGPVSTCCPAGNVLYVNKNATGLNDGTTWANAYTDLQSALNSPCAAVTEIWVAAGTYKPGTLRTDAFVMKNGVAIYGGFNGTETQLSARNWRTNLTILSGEIGEDGIADNAYRVINNTFTAGAPLNNSAVLDGFVIEAANANGGFPLNLGGGMWNTHASPTVQNCIFRNNTAAAGAGMFNDNSQATVTNCLFVGNTTTAEGAGIANGGGTASVKVINSTFYGNTGPNIINNQSNASITNCIIWGNRGGINGGTVTYSNVQGGFAGTGNLNVDPLFVNAAAGNFQLLQCSPSIDAGTNTNAPATDFEGNSRVDAITGVGIVDMGAYEYQATYDVCSACANTTGGIVYVNTSASGSNNGSSWANAFTDLQSALTLARTYPSCVLQIWVAAGTYKPTSGTDRGISFSMINGVAIYGGFNGTETQLSQRNWVTNETILSGDIDGTPDVVTGSGSTLSITGNDNNSYHVIYNNNNGQTGSSILNGFTISGGNANATESPNNNGGGMYNSNVSPTVTNCKFIHNDAFNWGGGMYLYNSNVTLENCSFNLNSSGTGGGVYTFSSLVFNHCQFSGNRAKVGGGGGIYVSGQFQPSVEMTDCQVTENSAANGFGGGITSFGGLTILSSQINNNTAGNAGGIVQANRELVMTNCEIKDNTTTFQGSGLNLQDVPNATLTNCVISGNVSQSSQGGIFVGAFNSLNSQATLINCTVANNTSVNGFKAIWTSKDRNEETIIVTLKNTIVANNPGGNFLRGNAPNTPVYFGTVQSQGHNLDSDGSSGLTNGVNGDLINADPLFVSSTDLHLQPCSPAINAGDDAGNATPTDIEGNNRKVSRIDMGAYEYQSSPPAALTPTVAFSHPTTCGGVNGSISLSGFLANTTYSIVYKKNTADMAAANFTSTGTGVITLPDLGAGSYTEIVAAYGTCVSNAATATLTDPVKPALTLSSIPAICAGATSFSVPYTNPTQAPNIYSISGTGITGLSDASLTNPITVNLSNPASGSSIAFTLTVKNTTINCESASIMGSVAVTANNTAGAASSSPTLCINTLLTNITHTTTGATGIGTPTNLPAGMSAAWASNTITISGTPTASGTFNYSIPLTGGCGSVSATGTITVIAKPTITLTLNGQTFNEGNNQVLCDTDPNPMNPLQFTVLSSCISGLPVWRTQIGAGNWSDWSSTAPPTQLSNNTVHRYQAACDGNCPSTYTNPIEVTINYRASTPQNVSLVADGTTVAAGQSATVCNTEGNTLTFNATCASGEILLYSIDGGDYSPAVPSQIVDNNFHNYRVRCRKADSTPSCLETESAAMSLKITTAGPAPAVSISPMNGCGTPTSFSGSSNCGALTTIWYNAATNQALPTLPTTTPNQTTSFYARCQNTASTGESGCLSENSNTVTFTITPVNDPPVVSASAEIVCTGTQVTISANCPNGSTAFWNTGVTTNSFQVAFSNVTKQTYWAKCIFSNGCQSPESTHKTILWKAFELTFINIGQSQSATKAANDRSLWTAQFITKDTGPVLENSTEANPTIYYSENVNKTAPRFWTIQVETCALGTEGSVTYDMLASPEVGVVRSYNTHENNAPYLMYANREGFTELYAQNHPAYGFYQDNGSGGNVYDTGLPKGLYKLGIRYWNQKGQGSIYPSTRQPAGNVLAYQEYWFRIQSQNGVGTGAAREAVTSLGDEKQEPWIQLAQNPITNQIAVKIMGKPGEEVSLGLVNVHGQIIQQKDIKLVTAQQREMLPTDHIASGLYLLKAVKNGEVMTFKVVKID